MNLKHLDKVWRENCPEEANGLVGKRKIPKKWKIMLDNYNGRKSICCFCFNKFNVEELSPILDGGSGGYCKKCEDTYEK